MSFPTLRASRSRLSLIPLIALAVIAIAAFALGSDAAAASTGGVSAGSGGGKAKDAKNATGAKYDRIWDRIPSSEKRWADRVAECESGKDPNATALNGQYRGAFMFLRSSWRTSPKSPGGDPIDYSYKTQAVVAVLLKKELGTKPWPVCG